MYLKKVPYFCKVNKKLNQSKMESMEELRQLQATLTKISLGQPVFFNIVQFRDKFKLVKEHGKDSNGFTRWVLTEKAKQILNVG